jgi:hypothetical protein
LVNVAARIYLLVIASAKKGEWMSGGLKWCQLLIISIIVGLRSPWFWLFCGPHRLENEEDRQGFFARVGARQVLPGLQEVNAIMASTPFTLHDKSLPHSNHLG